VYEVFSSEPMLIILYFTNEKNFCQRRRSLKAISGKLTINEDISLLILGLAELGFGVPLENRSS
jgi:hypothetical protein